MTLAAWLHTIDPFVFRITETFGIRWYGLAYVAAFIIGFLLLRALGKRRLVLIPPQHALDAVVLLVVGILVGGRLGYIFLYEPRLLWSFSSTFPFWGVLELHRGGMASHGGMIGVAIACVRIARGFKDESGTVVGRCPTLHVMDTVAFLAPPGLLLGRIANFVNGELLGRIVARPGQPAPWWAVRFPQEHFSGYDPDLTSQQIFSLTALIDKVRLPDDSLQRGYERLVERIQHGSSDLAAQLEPLLSARHPSQLYQAFAEGVVLGLVLLFVWRKPRKPGVVGCWFLITYGLLRIATEYWRLPDAHLAVRRVLGLSRGQWFSAAMIVIGLVLLWFVIRRNAEKLGGWAAPRTDPGSRPDSKQRP